jgi:hypothetical protein
MTLKKRQDITRDVKGLKTKGLDANQKAIDLARLAEKTKETFDLLNSGVTNESQLGIDRSNLETRQSIDLKHQSEIEKVKDVSTHLDEYQSKFETAISANIADISQLDQLKQQASLDGIDFPNLQEAKIAKQQEIEFLSHLDHNIDQTQEQLKQHLAESRQRRRNLYRDYKKKDLSPVIEQPSEFEDNSDRELTTEYLNENLSDPNFPAAGVQLEEWQQLLAEFSQSIVPFINKTVASITIPFSMLTTLIGSPPFIQMTKVGINFLKSSVEIIADVYPDLVDLNNRTLGANWSTLSDESIFKIISDISEEHEKLHFGDEEVAEFVNEYASAEEEKDRKRRRDRQLFDDASSSTDSSPTPPKESSTFAKSLSYGHLYGKNEPISFGVNDRGGTLQALLPDGTNSECYVNYSIDNSGRIKIGDIQVPPNLQRQGIATLLFKDLEERVPVGTTFFFVENQSPEFWASAGFQFDDRTKEYYKIKSDPIPI